MEQTGCMAAYLPPGHWGMVCPGASRSSRAQEAGAALEVPLMKGIMHLD